MERKEYVRLVLQHWKLIAALTAIGLVIGMVVGITRPALYQTGAKVKISFSITNPLETPPDWGSKNDLYNTIVSAATSESALGSIAEKNKLPSDDIKALQKLIIVDPVEQTEYIKIVVSAPGEQQAVNITKDVMAYMRNASNQLWFDQLNTKVNVWNKQLATAKQNYEAATQAYGNAKKKYGELETQAYQDLTDLHDKQVQGLNSQLAAAQKKLQTASSAIPRDLNGIQLAKDEVDRLQIQLDQALQSGPSNKLSDTKQAELNQQAGLSDALAAQQNTRAKISELEGTLQLAELMKSFPDMHAAAVSIVDAPLEAALQSRNIPLYTGAGLLLGLLLSLGLILVSERPRRLLDKARASNRVYQQPILTTLTNFKPQAPRKTSLPKLSKTAAQPVAGVAEVASPASLSEAELPEAVRETFRALANKLVNFYQPESQSAPANPRSRPPLPASAPTSLSTATTTTPLRLLVTSGFSRVGKTLVARNIAWSLAEEGYSILLIDASRKNPTLATSLLPKEAKLAGVGGGGVSSEGVAVLEQVQPTIYSGVDLLPGAALPVTGHGQLQQKELNRMLESFGERYQFIICDTPALETSAEATALVQTFPNLLFVANCELAEAPQEREYVNSLLRTGLVTRCGVMINRFEREK